MPIYTLVSVLGANDFCPGLALYRDGERTSLCWSYDQIADASNLIGAQETVNRLVNEARIGGTVTDEDEAAFRDAINNRSQTADPPPYVFKVAELGVSGLTVVNEPNFLYVDDNGVTLPMQKSCRCRTITAWQQDLDVHGDERAQVREVALNGLLRARDEHGFTHVLMVQVVRIADERLRLACQVRGANVRA